MKYLKKKLTIPLLRKGMRTFFVMLSHGNFTYRTLNSLSFKLSYLEDIGA